MDIAQLLDVSAAIVLATLGAALLLVELRDATLLLALFLAMMAADSLLDGGMLPALPLAQPYVLAVGFAALYSALVLRRPAKPEDSRRALLATWITVDLVCATGILAGTDASARPVVLARLAAFVAAGLLAIVSYARALRDHREAGGASTEKLLLVACGLGALTEAHVLGGHLSLLADALVVPLPLDGDVLLVYGPLAALAVALVVISWRHREDAGGAAFPAAVTLAGIAGAVVSHAAIVTMKTGGDLPAPAAASIQALFAPVRWLAFALVASAAFLRTRDANADDPRRRLAARVLLATLVFTAGAVVVAVADSISGAPSDPLVWIAVGVAILLSQGFRNALAKLARLVYGHAELPPPRAVTIAGDLAPGRVLAGRYRILRLIGRGGEGRVFHARDEKLAREVALKELPAGQLREGRALARVRDPHVLAVFDVLDLAEADVLVLEYAEGGSLSQALRDGRVLDDEDAARVLLDVLAGLTALHRAGVAHGDIKPSNVLLAASGEAKLADLGTSGALAERTRVGSARALAMQPEGTPGLLAPEQQRGEPASALTDVYQAGLLLRAIAMPGGPLAEVADRAAASEPADRYQSADEMALALSPYAVRHARL